MTKNGRGLSNQEEDKDLIEVEVVEDRMFTHLQSKRHTQETKKEKINPLITIKVTEVEVEEVEIIEVGVIEAEVIEVEEEKEVEEEEDLAIDIIRKQKRKEIGHETIRKALNKL